MMKFKFPIIILLTFFFVLMFNYCSDQQDENADSENLSNEIKNATLRKFNGFYFVGLHSGVTSILRYDYEKDKVKLFWHSKDERVIDLLIAPDYKSGFFITKRKQRLKSSLPAIERGKLYRIDFELNKAESITQLVEGIQVIPFWIDNDRFTLVINSIDKTIASYINKNTQVYNRFGKLLSDNTEIFDITKDGYPLTKLPQLSLKSQNEMFTVIEKKDSIFVKNTKSKKEIKTRFKNKKILQINWAENNKHLLILMIPKSNVQVKVEILKPILAVFDLQLKKTVKIFDNVSFKNFVLIGDFLIFDKGIGRDSEIEIVKLESLNKFKTIKLNGGCSLRSL